MDFVLLIFPAIFIVIAIFTLVIGYKEQKKEIIGTSGMFFTMSLLLFSVFFNMIGFNDGYRKGQIDAINKEIMFEKVEQPDGEVLWEKIKEKE